MCIIQINANAVLPYEMATNLPFTKSSEGMYLPSKPDIPLRKELRYFFADYLGPTERAPKVNKRHVDSPYHRRRPDEQIKIFSS